MNTFHDPHVREAFAQLTNTFHRMDKKLTAAFEGNKKQSAALETIGGHHVTEPTPILSTAGGLPQNEPSALQDIDKHSSGYSAGLSGRLAS